MPETSSHAARDARDWAQELGISVEAVELYQACDVLDLHVDSFIWSRVFGYDLCARHEPGALGARYFGQVDIPRACDAGMTGALWSITTNPFRSPSGRARAFEANVRRLCDELSRAGDAVELVRDAAGYEAARARGRHAAFLAVQGGNAVDASDDALDGLIDAGVIAVTLVHLSTSSLGVTSSPLRTAREGRLHPHGQHVVERLNAARVFVDLAHISPHGFDDAVQMQARDQPLLVSHTGVSGVHPLWRNIDDAQLRAVADTGGVVGVIFHGGYLGAPYWSGGKAERIVDHLEHIVRTVGADHAALGSDFDGLIIPPRDLPTCSELPRLVQGMLERRFSPDEIRKVLGGSFLRALRMLRG